MMAAQTYQKPERIYGPIDYLLTGVYACLAAFATGVSVGSMATAWMFVGIIAFGTLFSFGVQWLIGDQPVAKYDGLLYLAVGLAVFFFKDDLTKMVPDQPFQDQLLLTGTFCWMLALGSFFTWRDGTLLFQAVPSIALFGMVGIFDTFKATPFLFFALLVCLSTLFARSHRRQMIEQAEASGYKAMLAKEDAAGGEAIGGARLQAILQGPWKWMAGPEWALASALGIVMISLLGAPALRLALKPYGGVIHIPPPPLTASQATTLLGRNDQARVQIGQGPANLRETPVLIVETDEKRYMRVHTYGVYSSLGWSAADTRSGGADSSTPADGASIAERSLSEIKDRIPIRFSVTVLENTIRGLPIPGEIEKPKQDIAVQGGDGVPQERSDGTIVINNIADDQVIPKCDGTAIVSRETAEPRDAGHDLPYTMQSYLDTSTIQPTVINFAKDASKDGKTDYDKALLIQHAIEKQCLYNLKAPRTPANADPVEYFLFNSKQGYCDLFASSMTLMARSVGIPARYVTGFYPIKGTKPPGQENDPNAWQINESEAHAWSELFFKDVGWVAFDATEGAAYAPGEAPGDPTSGQAWYKAGWVETALDGLILVMIIGGAFFAYGAYRRNSRGRVPSRNDVGLEYARYVAVLQKLSGKRRLPSQTPDEYLEVTKTSLGDHAASAERVNTLYVSALYSPNAVSEGILKQLRAETESLRQELKANGNGKSGKPHAESKK
jgi:transglutaminase-like putative cysteine protease